MTAATLDAARIDAIVVGASAGGVEALCGLLPALPHDPPAAVLVVLHLPRERPSLLADIFQPKCARPVREAQDKEPVEPGTVMPASALRLFAPTHVLSLEAIAALLATLSPAALAAEPTRGRQAAGTRRAGESRR